MATYPSERPEDGAPAAGPARSRLPALALVLAVLGTVPEVLIAAVNASGLPYRLMNAYGLTHTRIITYHLGVSAVSSLCLAAVLVGLILGVVAVTQMRCRARSQHGKRMAWAAVGTALGGLALVRLIYMVSSLAALVSAGPS